MSSQPESVGHRSWQVSRDHREQLTERLPCTNQGSMPSVASVQEEDTFQNPLSASVNQSFDVEGGASGEDIDEGELRSPAMRSKNKMAYAGRSGKELWSMARGRTLAMNNMFDNLGGVQVSPTNRTNSAQSPPPSLPIAVSQ